MEREEIGSISHHYGKISVAIIELSGTLKVGDRIAIVGPKTELVQDVKSLQVEHQNIEQAKQGDLVGLKVKDKVREGDCVFKLLTE